MLFESRFGIELSHRVRLYIICCSSFSSLAAVAGVVSGGFRRPVGWFLSGQEVQFRGARELPCGCGSLAQQTPRHSPMSTTSWPILSGGIRPSRSDDGERDDGLDFIEYLRLRLSTHAWLADTVLRLDVIEQEVARRRGCSRRTLRGSRSEGRNKDIKYVQHHGSLSLHPRQTVVRYSCGLICRIIR